MIQIYSPGNTEYDKNGDMTIFPTKAEIGATLNNTWQLNLEHPIDKTGRWKYIQEDAVVKLPSFNGDQLFRIRNKKKASSGITATAEPIFMDAMYDCFLNDVRPTAKNGQEALDIMTAPNAKYSGKSDITKRTTAYYEYKNLIEAINGDDDNSFINRWGGEILFDNFEITINERVGGDYGVTLQYGKNIQKNGITESVDMTGIVTRIYPKAYNGYKLSGDGYVDSPLLNSYPIVKVATISFEDVKMAEDAQEGDEENGVTICNSQEELDTALRQKCNEQFSAGIDKPSVNITADMVLLQNTRQYKNYAVLEQVSLGDTIHCRHVKLGITTDARVISLKYDAIKRKVTYVELGDFTYNYFNNVSSSVDRIDQVIRPDGTVMADKIAGFINGAMASLRAQYDVAKKQDVMAILFENLDKYSTLYGAMALGTQGLMISKTRTADGREWDWTTAMTAAGLIANVIIAGIIADQKGRNYWNLDTGEFALSATGFTVDGKPAEDYFKDTWSQEEVFNKLTNNGVEQGIYLSGGKLYINASYMQIGTITDKNKKNYWNLATGEFSLSSNSFNVDGESADDFFKGSLSQDDIFNKLTNNGQVQGIYLQSGRLYINADYIQAGTIKDKTGKSWWNLTTGEFNTENGTFTGTITGSTIVGSEIRFQKQDGTTIYLGNMGLGITDENGNNISFSFNGLASDGPDLWIANSDASKYISINYMNGLTFRDGDSALFLKPESYGGSWKNFITIQSNGETLYPIMQNSGLGIKMSFEWNATGSSYLVIEDSIWGRYRVPMEKA